MKQRQLIDAPQNRNDVLFNLKVKLNAIKKYRRKWFMEKEIKDTVADLFVWIKQQSNQQIELYEIQVEELILSLNVAEHKLVPQSIRYHFSGEENTQHIHLFNTTHCVGRIIVINQHYPQMNIKDIREQVDVLVNDFSDYLRKMKLDITKSELQDVYIGYLTAKELEILSPCYLVDIYYQHFPGVDGEDYYQILQHSIKHDGVDNFIYGNEDDKNLNYGRSTKQLQILNDLLKKAKEIK